jgi:tetratricopeptide (TPR) repeat protein
MPPMPPPLTERPWAGWRAPIAAPADVASRTPATPAPAAPVPPGPAGPPEAELVMAASTEAVDVDQREPYMAPEAEWQPPPAPPPDPSWPEPVMPPTAQPPPETDSPVERCYELYEARRFHEVVREGMAALESSEDGPVAREPDRVARLWGVVGLARQALGEPDAAHLAFGEAIAAAAPPERGTWERHLAGLALEVGRYFLARGENAGLSDAEERVAAYRTAAIWLERGLVVAPDDRALGESAQVARVALWPTYEHVAMELMQRQDYDGARRLLQGAVVDPDCPADFQPTFRELLASTYSGEVGQLTAEALRRMREGREAEALTTLERAEAMLSAVPDEGLAERRRQELEQRLWWSFTKVGIRWLEAGLYEEALPPLIHALRFTSVGAQRLEETRGPLARALGGLVEARTLLVEQLLGAKERKEARELVEKLWALIDEARAQGMTDAELGDTVNRARVLRERAKE